MNNGGGAGLQRRGRARPRPARARRLWLRLAPAALAVSAAACEVQWGGVQVEVGEPKFERPAALEARSDTGVVVEPVALPEGPLLFHVRRTDAAGGAIIDPVAELADSGLAAVGPREGARADEYAAEFVERYYASEQPYVLFRDGARVGTFYTRAPRVTGSGVCLDLAAEGWVELRPDADTLSEFTAWPPRVRRGADTLRAPTYREDMITLSQVLARRGVDEGGVPGAWRFRPPDDLRALNVGTGRLGFAATFVVGDTLAPRPPPDSAGSVFVVADYSPAIGYFPLFFDARWYGPGGKRALRWVDQVDLIEGQPGAEWLLEAYGDRDRWYEVVGGAGADRAVLWSGRRPECAGAEPGAREATG